jgi:acetoin utilization deacetylase AcuC-like enzyme
MVKCVWSPDYEVDIGDHVFPTAKYRLIRERLLQEAICTEEDFLTPEPATNEQLLTAHTPAYLEDLAELRRSERTLYSELPLNRKIVDAYRLAAGGTLLAARTAMTQPGRIACHIGGGFHHAFADHAEGFCYINDIAVAIRVLQGEGQITRAAVIDCDLHQGNGTAHIFLNDDTVTTLSIHQENNYPTKQKSDVDIGLEDYADDVEYLSHLQDVVPKLLDTARPDLLIYVAGADPYQDDVLGRLKLTMQGLLERDELVLSAAAERRIPVATVTAGGYARHTADTVKIHAQTCAVAARLARA